MCIRDRFYVDFGAFANRAVTIPFYATSSPAQAQYIINDAQIRFLFVGEQYQYDAAFSCLLYTSRFMWLQRVITGYLVMRSGGKWKRFE